MTGPTVQANVEPIETIVKNDDKDSDSNVVNSVSSDLNPTSKVDSDNSNKDNDGINNESSDQD